MRTPNETTLGVFLRAVNASLASIDASIASRRSNDRVVLVGLDHDRKYLRIDLGSVGFERPGRLFQLTTQDALVAWGFDGQCHAIARQTSDFDDDVIADMDPLARFSAEY